MLREEADKSTLETALTHFELKPLYITNILKPKASTQQQKVTSLMHVLVQRPCKHMGIKNITILPANMGKANSTALNTGHRWCKKVSSI